MSEEIKVCLVGAKGRMGQAIKQVVRGTAGINIYKEVDPDHQAHFDKYRDISKIDKSEVKHIDVVIEFTNPENTVKTAKWCADHEKTLVSGTTGLSDEQKKELLQLANVIPIFWAPNMSPGVNLINSILPQLSNALTGYDLEIIEKHHRGKKDAPSGTAKLFAQTIASKTNQVVVFGRASEGLQPDRKGKEIIVHSIRSGSIAGEHEVLWAGEDEEICIIHRASSRMVFARGAVRAAKWLIEEKIPSGLWGMENLLGLE
jgi:4-hydroxy-tetrahydrodipicolinate reductase